MICWTLKRASSASSLGDIFVAAEDPEIVAAVQEWGGKAELVQGNFICGSDRVAAAVRKFDAPAIVNIQADVPLLDPEILDKALSLLFSDPGLDVTTAVTDITDLNSYRNPDCVKVVLDAHQRCLYFSRSPIPALPGTDTGTELPPSTPLYRHIGLYCFRREALERFATFPPSPLEESESLEQLRILENGGKIGAVIAAEVGPGVDSPEDLLKAEEYITNKNISFSEAS
jgi:3-deoxy-manno-octulosonate cytidylyltransferase (CMP-KDO synthetase)